MTPSQSKVTVVTILLSLFDRVGRTECHSEQIGVIYDGVVERTITLPNSAQYGYYIPWSSSQVQLAVTESTARLLNHLTNVIRKGDVYRSCSKYKSIVDDWNGRNIKLEAVVMDIYHYSSLEKAIQHCKRLDIGNKVQLFHDGNFDKPFTPIVATV